MRPALALLACALLSGCATNRSIIALDPPSAAAVSSSSAKTFVLLTVVDERVFEVAPSNPSIPSLGFEGANAASPALKARAVARKRNSYGKALGDVLLGQDETAETTIRRHLSAAMSLAGFSVVGSQDDVKPDIEMSVRIKEFWAWFKPGFWAITLSAKIATELEVVGLDEPTTVAVHTQELRQAATEEAWASAINKALSEYRAAAVGAAAPLRQQLKTQGPPEANPP